MAIFGSRSITYRCFLQFCPQSFLKSLNTTSEPQKIPLASSLFSNELSSKTHSATQNNVNLVKILLLFEKKHSSSIIFQLHFKNSTRKKFNNFFFSLRIMLHTFYIKYHYVRKEFLSSGEKQQEKEEEERWRNCCNCVSQLFRRIFSIKDDRIWRRKKQTLKQVFFRFCETTNTSLYSLLVCFEIYMQAL